MTTDQPKTAREWAEHVVRRDCNLPETAELYELIVNCVDDDFRTSQAQAREAALTDVIAVCRAIEARDLGGVEWLHARRCAAAIEALRAQAPTEWGA